MKMINVLHGERDLDVPLWGIWLSFGNPCAAVSQILIPPTTMMCIWSMGEEDFD